MNFFRHIVAVLLIASLKISLFAQVNLPEAGELYNQSTVPRIDILIHPDTLDLIYENPHSDREYRAVFVFDNGKVHDTINEIGFRLRGNTSRDAWKKSFKVSFNTFIKGRKYKGVEKMDLNGEHNDPSSSRSLIYWHILREANIPGPRANHVTVYINGSYYGLYTNVEHIDEEFVKTYFGNNDGNLYKCLWPADLTYRGPGQNSYKFKNGGQRAYDLKTNEEKDDYSDLVNFISVLNNTTNTELPCELEKVFNVQSFLKVVAIDVLTSNWDGYSFNKNNYYLYHNQQTGLFEYIPYDVDNTFGIDWFNINWATRNIYNWSANEPRPLFKRLMALPVYKAQYTFYVKQIMEEIMTNPSFTQFVSAIKEQARPYLIIDPLYPLDYGYTIESFDDSWTTGAGDHVPFGINEFIQKRIATAKSQCNVTDATPMISRIENNYPLAKEDLIISAFIEDEELVSSEVIYRINNGAWQTEILKDDGENHDKYMGDHTFTATIKGYPDGTNIEYYIKVTDTKALVSEKPCDVISYTFPGNGSLQDFTVWPNPTNGNSIYLSRKVNYKVYDLTGRLLLEGKDSNLINVTSVRAGICILKTDDGTMVKIAVTR